jgi:hypothetical protein
MEAREVAEKHVGEMPKKPKHKTCRKSSPKYIRYSNTVTYGFRHLLT